MSNKFIINCNGRERFRIKSYKSGTTHSNKHTIILQWLIDGKWSDIEREDVITSDEINTIATFISRITLMYGAPKPTEIILYNHCSPIRQELFRKRYEISDDVELNTTEVEVLDNE